MRVLLLETNPNAADGVADLIEGAGHHIHRCHEPGKPSFPCSGLDEGACPLDANDIDVAVTVRARPHPRPTPTEDGVTCAIRHGVPVVVAGNTALQPFERWAAASVPAHEVLDAILRVQHEPLPHLSAAVTGEVRRLAELHGLEGGSATVTRADARSLRVVLHLPQGSPESLAGVVAVRAAGLVRGLDPTTRSVSVVEGP